MTDRKTAEAARRRVIEIDDLEDAATLEQRAERGRLVRVWNGFCAEENRRLPARRRNGTSAAVYETYRKLGWS
jgi:hypothetical protein